MDKNLPDNGDKLAYLLENQKLPLGLSALWIAISLAYCIGFYFADPRPDIGFTQVASALFSFVLPLLLIWGSFAIMGTIATERRKADRLEEGMEILFAEMQEVKAALASPPTSTAPPEVIALPDQTALAGLTSKIAELSALVEAQSSQTEQDTPAPAPKQPARRKPAPETTQPLLPMDAPGDSDILTRDELVAALNFPQDERDKAGFAILKKARNSREVAQILQAAEDILTLLAQRGVYMDDFTYSSVPVKQWRSFARGTRGKDVAQMAAILDEEAENKTRETVRTDPVFRDTSLHFQRRFDVTLAEFCEGATDAELAAFANTRTARAFVLLSKVSGVIGSD